MDAREGLKYRGKEIRLGGKGGGVVREEEMRSLCRRLLVTRYLGCDNDLLRGIEFARTWLSGATACYTLPEATFVIVFP